MINGYLGDHGLSLRQGTLVDAALILALSSTRNKDGKLDPQMHLWMARRPLLANASAMRKMAAVMRRQRRKRYKSATDLSVLD